MLEKIKSEPALVSGAVQAVLGLLLAFGVSLSIEQTGAILAVTAAVLAFFVRQAVTPLEKLMVDEVDGGDHDVEALEENEYGVDVRNEYGYAAPGWAIIVGIVLLVLILLFVTGILRLG